MLELADVLTDVRRAYRLLWAFQNRILDYNKLIYERLNFTQWAPWGAPSSLLGPVGQTLNTSWVHLPMADMEFRAYRRHKDDQYAAGKIWTHYPKTNDTLLYIRVRADAGMPPLVRNDPCPLTFDAVELCQTRLGLFIVLNRLDRDQSAPLWEASNACRSTPAGGEKAVEHPTIKGYSIYGKDVDLATLPDEGALVAWIDAFKDAAENALSVNFSELPDA